MRKVKGFVTYVYKGVQYFEQPKKTHISRIEYDDAENMSTVYLKRNTAFTEILCLALLCATVYFVYTYGNYVQKVHMPKSAYCYDNKLYLNMYADESNSNPVSYTIAGCSGVLNPGEYLDCVDYVYTNQASETITYTVEFFGIDREFTTTIPVGAIQFDEGGTESEGY